MELPVYITMDEVKRVCQALGIRDWSALTEPDVQPEEARIILNEVNLEGMEIDLESFRVGLEVELEHGTSLFDAPLGKALHNGSPAILVKSQGKLDRFGHTLDRVEGIARQAVCGGHHCSPCEKNEYQDHRNHCASSSSP